MNPCSPNVLFSKHFRDEAPLDKLAQFRDIFKAIDPRRLRLLEKRDQEGPRGGATYVANAPRRAGCRERPRAATPCRNTKAARARKARNPPIADQKRDGKLPLERVLPRITSFKRSRPHRVDHCFICHGANSCHRSAGTWKRIPPLAQIQVFLQIPVQPSRVIGRLTPG